MYLGLFTCVYLPLSIYILRFYLGLFIRTRSPIASVEHFLSRGLESIFQISFTLFSVPSIQISGGSPLRLCAYLNLNLRLVASLKEGKLLHRLLH
jgi:hypothetical protein